MLSLSIQTKKYSFKEFGFANSSGILRHTVLTCWIIYSSLKLVISLSYAINAEFPMLKVLWSSSPFSL